MATAFVTAIQNYLRQKSSRVRISVEGKTMELDYSGSRHDRRELEQRIEEAMSGRPSDAVSPDPDDAAGRPAPDER